MLKRFLKFFSSNDPSPSDEMDHPHVHRYQDGDVDAQTYLEFLFDTVEPRVKSRIEKYPTTDPLLELATGILLELFPEYWEDVDGPLIDDWSPQNETSMGSPDNAVPPPPPEVLNPPPVPSGGVDGTGVVEKIDDGETVARAEMEESDAEEIAEDSIVEESPVEVGEEESDVEEIAEDSIVEESPVEESPVEESPVEESPVEESPVEVGEEESDVEEIAEDSIVEESPVEVGEEESDVEEIAEEGTNGKALVDDDHGHPEAPVPAKETVETAPPAGFVSALDDTAEFEPPPIRRDDVDRSVWPMPLEKPSVLHGARVLLAVLLDNDRLPVSEQLSVAEVLMAADLWVHLISQAVDLDDRVQKLARLVEKKFGANYFSQARLLLKLFPANTETRINNDRQLFYEDMILRMGIQRRRKIDDEQAIIQALESAELDDDEAVRTGLESLAEYGRVKMHFYTREPEQVERWEDVAQGCDNEDMVPYVLDLIPPRRWRQCGSHQGRPVQELLDEHIVRPMVREHIIDHIKTCYFVLRAVGDTGLESYLDSFFDWSEQVMGVEAISFLPDLHRRLTTSNELIGGLFAEIYERHYLEPVEEALDEFDEQAMNEAFSEAVDRILDSDLDAVAEGNFDMGGLILDAYLEFDYPEPAFAFKLHRLT